MNRPISRRELIVGAGALALSGVGAASGKQEEIVDIHQHTHYARRTDEVLIAHQRKMGITKTVLLPAGSQLGLDAECYGNDSVMALAKQHSKEYVFFANEVPYVPDARKIIEKYLKLGAIGIGEQKFPVECDSPLIHDLAELAQEYDVPMLLHFQEGTYNSGFARFHTVLEKWPKVNFIGHAQTWWGNVDLKHDMKVLYPTTKVTKGGITDRLLSDYPNMFGDLSAGSGLNALLRDEEHARAFLLRHQSKLLYGSDCDDHIGDTAKCSGSVQLATLRRLVTDQKALSKILSGNAKRIMRL